MDAPSIETGPHASGSSSGPPPSFALASDASVGPPPPPSALFASRPAASLDGSGTVASTGVSSGPGDGWHAAAPASGDASTDSTMRWNEHARRAGRHSRARIGGVLWLYDVEAPSSSDPCERLHDDVGRASDLPGEDLLLVHLGDRVARNAPVDVRHRASRRLRDADHRAELPRIEPQDDARASRREIEARALEDDVPVGGVDEAGAVAMRVGRRVRARASRALPRVAEHRVVQPAEAQPLAALVH